MNCALCEQPIKSPALCKRCQQDWRSEVQSALDKRDIHTAVSHLAQLLPGMVRAAINRMFPGMPGWAFKIWRDEGISVAISDAYELLNPHRRVLPPTKNGKKRKPRITIKNAEHLKAYYVKRCRSLVRDLVKGASSGPSLPVDHKPMDRRTIRYLEAIERLADLAERLAPQRLQYVLSDIRVGTPVTTAIKREGKRRAALGIKHGFVKNQRKNCERVKQELRELGVWTEAAAHEIDMRQYRLRWQPPRKILLFEVQRECSASRRKSPLSSRQDDAA